MDIQEEKIINTLKIIQELGRGMAIRASEPHLQLNITSSSPKISKLLINSNFTNHLRKQTSTGANPKKQTTKQKMECQYKLYILLSNLT